MVFGVTCSSGGSNSNGDHNNSSTSSSNNTPGPTNNRKKNTTQSSGESSSSNALASAPLSYGAVGESDTVTLLSGVTGGGGGGTRLLYNNSTTSSAGGSSSSGAEDSGDECGGSVSSCGGGLSHQESCYQRQPLLPTHHHHKNSETSSSTASSAYSGKPNIKLTSLYHEGGGHSIISTGDVLASTSNFLNNTAATAVSAVNGLVKIQMPSPHRDEPRFPKEKLKTLWSFLFLVFNAFLTTTSLALTHERVPMNDPPLPDVLLDAFPVQQWGLTVSEIIIIIVICFTFMVVFFHKHRYIIMRRIFLILGLLYFYRAITMYVTVLPVANPSYYCSPKLNHTTVVVIIKHSLQLLSGFGLAINGQHTFCGDYIFSGHTSVLVIGYLIVKEYTPRRWWLLHWLYGLLALTGIIMVLLARGHYTVDCVIAYFISTRLWYMYHTMANNPNLKEAGQHNYFSRMWWFSLFRYFEGNVGGSVPRHYEWPLPWPRRWGAKLPQRTS
uniref:Phosphatidylcholine:ceramide cholinephosphotransferase 2-like n=2 Tax=Hirondellea gigas TaxID=1518452 RepID=A0A2P2HX28_9CRUS